jgi:hypothetical protein
MTVICFFFIEINDVLQQLIMLVIFKKSNIFTIFRKTTVVMNCGAHMKIQFLLKYSAFLVDELQNVIGNTMLYPKYFYNQ